LYHSPQMPVSETADPRAHAGRSARCDVALSASMKIAFALVVASTQCLAASSLSGTVLDESFSPLSGASVQLLPQTKQAPLLRVSTDAKGAFTFSGLASGKYTLRVSFSAFINFELQNIHIGEAEDHRLRRILLEVGAVGGNCAPRVYPISEVHHAADQEVEITGRVSIGRGQRASLRLDLFTENERLIRTTISDDKGRFRFVVPVAGDIRLEIETQNRAGDTVVSQQQANIRWADLGDKILIPRIKLAKFAKSAPWRFCY
jgi:hypothetical protein